ncbi:MBL fold metallo-hydrolase [Oceanobacillus sp. FSL K6-2867]|uniref:MBL fold metallo-hydrolase n=1 Tax=Oceanobacillus sp. FSL K6-2867 TaxID=2954748 RepID=UPI0030D6ED73
MKVKGMPLGPIGTNCYIVYSKGNALLIDPGAEADKIKAFLEREKLRVQAILLTHAHFDHIAALDEIRKAVGADVYIHENELSWLSDPQMNGSYKLLGNEIVMKPADFTFNIGPMKIGDFTFEVIHTPGHSPGSVSLIFDQDEFIISGDVLFYHGIGRTDLPGGNMKEIEASIKNKLYQLNDSCTVYPGHGPQTTIGEEKQNNPFVRA